MINNILTISIVACLVFFGTQNRRQRKTYMNNLYHNASFAIGEVVYYNSGNGSIVVPQFINSTGKAPEVEYKFTLDSTIFYNRYNAYKANVPSKNVKVGTKYLVICDKRDPNENRILFEYPIKDSSEYREHILQVQNLHIKN